MDDVAKSSHLLLHHQLKQTEGELGADFDHREAREFDALREMGVNVDDSMRLAKFIVRTQDISFIHCS